MTTPPPLLLGATLLFWGWQTGLLPIAIALALVIELSPVVRWRWDIDTHEFNRIADLSSVLFLLSAVYLFSTKALQGIFLILQWQPMLFFILFAAQRYSHTGCIKLSALFISIRRASQRDPATAVPCIDIGYPYFVVCLIAASSGNLRSPWFFAGICALLGWALWHNRPRRYPLALWAGLLLVSAAAGLAASTGIDRAQGMIANLVIGWFEHDWRERDPFRATTAIGTVGTLMQSDRIRLRVTLPAGQTPPVLLRQSSYNYYRAGRWMARKAGFTFVAPGDRADSWPLTAVDQPASNTRVYTVAEKDKRLVLALPANTSHLADLVAADVERNRFGVIRIDHKPGLVSYSAWAGGEPRLAADADDDDLSIDRNYRDLMADLATQLGLSGLPPTAAVARVKQYFADNFFYSLAQDADYTGRDPLARFLTDSRRGHCEFFATATTLLLRSIGIPTRYTVGFSVQEYSHIEDAYLVRDRHAHAWTEAWIDGHWTAVDTTPSNWAPLEAATAPWWEPLRDAGSLLRFLLARWQAGAYEEETARAMTWLAVPLLAWLVWRLLRRRRIGQTIGAAPQTAVPAGPGADSDFYAIIARLDRGETRRRPGETLKQWLARLRDQVPAPPDLAFLQQLADLHYRYRFDPQGLSRPARKNLQTRCTDWLARHG